MKKIYLLLLAAAPMALLTGCDDDRTVSASYGDGPAYSSSSVEEVDYTSYGEPTYVDRRTVYIDSRPVMVPVYRAGSDRYYYVHSGRNYAYSINARSDRNYDRSYDRRTSYNRDYDRTGYRSSRTIDSSDDRTRVVYNNDDDDRSTALRNRTSQNRRTDAVQVSSNQRSRNIVVARNDGDNDRRQNWDRSERSTRVDRVDQSPGSRRMDSSNASARGLERRSDRAAQGGGMRVKQNHVEKVKVKKGKKDKDQD